MVTRRAFMNRAAAGAAALVSFRDDGLARAAAAADRADGRGPEDVAADESYWREIQQAFTLDRTVVNLNNGGCCPSPRVVHEALKRYLDISNQAPVYHMWQILEPNIETVRRGLASRFGCDPEELAITRNASEALQIAQLGIDLRAGDEVVTTNQDYGRMLDTWEQRVRRDRIKLTRISFPVPAPSLADLADRLLAAITPATRVLHFCHITNLTGQIFPVRQICEEARRRGITTIVDGAHAFAHFPFTAADLGCDFYGTSLHKWLLAPIGTGFLYVRRDRIERHWPLTPAPVSKQADIRKFEEIGTHPAANHNAIAEAITFHDGIGAERKAARLRYLRDRWAARLARHGGIRLHTSLEPSHSCAIGTVQIVGTPAPAVVERLWARWRIIATPIVHAEYEGVRVTPNVYTTLDEIDTFAGAMEELTVGVG
ncbi:MAG TPA: aminotransferase class V-fold PLP-dependent enzyme [Vicinamibacterales bacterium]|jgi:selenocysteine lyase/cysteine desulfurase|nr:aminotransferase class V-fold PLP-dependent enzyme [Vicinamibacterales bacterium]